MKKAKAPCCKYYLPLMALGLALLALVLLVSGAAAHGPEILVKTDPPDGVVLEQSPAKVMAWFSTELETSFSTLEVFDINHHQVDNGDGGVDPNDLDHASMIVSLPTLSEGVYLVRWTAVTAEDGELVAGLFTFGVAEGGVTTKQEPTAQAPPVDTGGDTPPSLVAAAGLGIVLLVVIGLVLYFRFARGSPQRV